MARSVKDLAILFDVLAGPDPKDPTSQKRAPEPASHDLDEIPSGLKMGVHADYFFQDLDPDVQSLVETAISDLEKLGLERVAVSIPEIEHQSTCRNVITFAEAASYHQPSLRERPEDYGPATKELLELGLLVSATEYLAAQRARRRIIDVFSEAFQGFDVLVAPTVPVPAPPIGEEVLANGEKLRPGLLRLPTPFNTTGFPAISVPCGFTPRGLPVGLQLAAGPFLEKRLLQLAYAYEKEHPWTDRHPSSN